MARKYSSTAVETTLSGTITSGATSMTVGSVTGWPSSPSVSAPYSVILDPDTASEEVVEVTGAAGTVLTIVRGVDGTSAKAHNAGAVAKHGVSARDFSEPAAHIDNTTTAHGVTGAVVGTTNTQTLTNKTIDASLNTISNITSAMITDGTIVNADINASAAIAVSKLASSSVTIGGATATLGGANVTSVTGMVLDSTSTIGGVSGTKIAQWTGAWTSYTPTVSGYGAGVTPVVTGAYAYVSEKTVIARVKITFSAFATPGSSIISVTLPVNASSSGQTLGVSPIGTGIWDGASTAPYFVTPVWRSATTFGALVNGTNTPGLSTWTGAVPAGQAAADEWYFQLFYEAA